jgi:hypothetical protein
MRRRCGTRAPTGLPWIHLIGPPVCRVPGEGLSDSLAQSRELTHGILGDVNPDIPRIEPYLKADLVIDPSADPSIAHFVRNFASKIRFARTGLPLASVVFTLSHYELSIMVTMEVMNRDNLEQRVKVHNSMSISCLELLQGLHRTELVLHAMRNILCDMVVHEMNECFQYDGVRIRDPHPAPRSALAAPPTCPSGTRSRPS